jgi:hypothetical protein
MGWLPFALFGLLYGRILIHGHFKSTTAVSAYNASLSVIFALLFVSTRLLQYGNLTTHCLATPDQNSHHHHQKENDNQYLASIKSFFYVSKYPPSPAFAFFTLSGCYLLLAIFSTLTQFSNHQTSSKFIKSRYNPLLVYGNQPLFFYGVHMLFLHFISIPILNSKLAHPLPPGQTMSGKGVGLTWVFWTVYVVTLIVMYFACWYYSIFKLKSGRESVWRFL